MAPEALTLERQLTILKHLAAGRAAAFAAAAVRQDEAQVLAVAEEHGYPDIDKVRLGGRRPLRARRAHLASCARGSSHPLGYAAPANPASDHDAIDASQNGGPPW